MFDVTDSASFRNIKQWLQEIDRYACESVSRLLVGNKVDLSTKRVVSNEEMKNFAKSLGIPCMETSAKTGFNVDDAFLLLTQTLYEK